FSTPILASVDSSWQIQGGAPALQVGTGQSATAFAHAMASMGAAHSSSAAVASTTPATPQPLIAVTGHAPSGLTASA
ncbi:MAG: hypothetical protein JWO83_3772, partial [Caulobacteraceae bacterium]|nr:hypothetical protein [Caulobacteraceae bacterium]